MRSISHYVLQRITLMALLCSFALLSFQSLANSDTNNYIKHHVKGDSVYISTTENTLKLSHYGHNAIEVHYLSNSPNNAYDNLPSFAIKEDAKQQPFVIFETSNSITLQSKKLKAVIQKSPFTIHYYQDEKLLLKETGYFSGLTLDTDENKTPTPIQGVRFALMPNEKLLGGGERVLGMDRRGHRMPLYNRAHYGYTTESNQMNFSLPAVMSSNKYILLFDNSAKGWMDLGNTEKNTMQFEAVSGRSAYIVFSGDSYPNLIHNYVELTGKQPMPPRWALGNYASRFGYKSEKQVRDTVNKFIEKDFPLDALILDLYWFGKDIKGHMGNLDWDKEAFPNPVKMINDIKKQGVNTVLITEPFVLTTSKKWSDATQQEALAKDEKGQPKTFDFYFGNTGLIDVFSHKGEQWFSDIYSKLYHQGVAGWWGDLGEPEVHPSDTLHTLKDGSVVNADAIHNVYGHQWAKMVYDNQLTLAPNKRPFILMRSGFAGSQRYGMIPWTGDVSRSWGGLKPQVELSLQMGVLGMAYTHSDLGGFAGGDTFDKEMYIRWLQYGVFQPIYRPHAQDSIAPEVVFHDQETQDILRKFIKLRYQLLPYNYTLAYQNSTTGMPLMRPLFFEEKGEDKGKESTITNHMATMDNASSYLWGDAFLVTPVVDPGVKFVNIALPSGVWFNYFSNEKYIGNNTVKVPTRLETLPVLVRAGSFVPMIEAIQSTQNYSSETLTLHYYADNSVKKSQGTMYEDNGNTHKANEKGEFELLSFHAEQNVTSFNSKGNKAELKIHLSHQGNGYEGMPAQREITLVVHNWQSEITEVTLSHNQDDFTLDSPNPESDNLTSQKSANKNINYHYDEGSKSLSLTFIWQHKPITLEVK